MVLGSAEEVKGKGSYKWVVLGLLTLIYTFNFIDRQIIVILAEPIKAEFGLSDQDLGWLTGLAFAAIYVVLGIPLARFADSHNRKNIVTACLAIWSVMTAVSGMAANFVHLLLARVGVGIGEAGCSPPSHAIISDYFPQEKRATALSIYSMGIYLGILLGFVVGAVIAKQYGWRNTFYIIGIAGVVLSVLSYFFIREPIRGAMDDTQEVSEVGFGDVLKYLWSKKTFVYISIAGGLNTFATYGVGNFLPSFWQRVHGLSIVEAGIAMGLTAGFGGMIGTFGGGWLSDKLQVKDKRWYMWIVLFAGLFNIIPSVLVYFSDNTTLAISMSFFTSLLTAVYMGPSLAVSYSLINAKMRALTSSIFFFVLNFIGLGFGPLVIGILSDYFEPSYGNLSLRYAFTITFATGILSAVFYYLASRTYRKDLEEVIV